MSEVPVRLLRERCESRRRRRGAVAGVSRRRGGLAAWADDTLGRDERTARIARGRLWTMQALLAAMSRSAPPLSPAPAWWRRPAFGWLAPFAAATAAFLVWFNVTTSDSHDAAVPGSTVQVRAPASVERVPPAAVSTDNSSKPETKVDQLADAGAQTSPPSAVRPGCGATRRATTLGNSSADARTEPRQVKPPAPRSRRLRKCRRPERQLPRRQRRQQPRHHQPPRRLRVQRPRLRRPLQFLHRRRHPRLHPASACRTLSRAPLNHSA